MNRVALAVVASIVLGPPPVRAEPLPQEVRILAETMARDLVPVLRDWTYEERGYGSWTIKSEGFEMRVHDFGRIITWKNEDRLTEIRRDFDDGPGEMTSLDVGWAAAKRILVRLSLAERGLLPRHASDLEPYRRRTYSDDRLVSFTFQPKPDGLWGTRGNSATIVLDKKDLAPVQVSLGRGYEYRLGRPISRAAATEIVRREYEKARVEHPGWEGGRTAPDWSGVQEALILEYAHFKDDPRTPARELIIVPQYRYYYARWIVLLDAQTGDVVDTNFRSGQPLPSDRPRQDRIPAWILVVGVLAGASLLFGFWYRRRSRGVAR